MALFGTAYLHHALNRSLLSSNAGFRNNHGEKKLLVWHARFYLGRKAQGTAPPHAAATGNRHHAVSQIDKDGEVRREEAVGAKARWRRTTGGGARRRGGRGLTAARGERASTAARGEEGLDGCAQERGGAEERPGEEEERRGGEVAAARG